MKALLFSGGIESTCLAYWKRPDICLTVDYGQICAKGEIESATAIAKHLKLNHRVVRLRSNFKYGMLSGEDVGEIQKPEFWPFRNQLLGTIAAMTLYRDNVREIWFGSVGTDTRFLDGSRGFFKAFNNLSSQQEGGIKIEAPALELSSERLIAKSKTPRSILGATFSCHMSSIACGDCPGCRKHQRLLYK